MLSALSIGGGQQGGLRKNEGRTPMIGSTAFSASLKYCSESTHSVSLHLHLMHLVVVLDTEASYNRKPVGAKQKRGACFIVSHAMSHVLDYSELSRSRSGDVDHLVVTRNGRDVLVGLACGQKAALSQGLSLVEVCRSRDHPQYRPLGLA